jgi:hypothetical protein
MRKTIFSLLFCVAMFPAHAQYNQVDTLKGGPGSVARSSREQLDILPHAIRHDRIVKRFYPHLFGTIGISSYNPNFDGLQQVLRRKEADYFAQGVKTGKGNITSPTSPLAWVSFGVDFVPEIRVELEGGWNFEEKSRIYAGSLGVYYMPPFAQSNSFRVFIGPGIVVFRATMGANYYASLKFGTLTGIEMKAQQTGGFLRGGVEWEVAKAISVVLNGSYFLVKPATSDYYPGSANFSSFSAGMRMLFHFSGGSTP